MGGCPTQDFGACLVCMAGQKNRAPKLLDYSWLGSLYVHYTRFTFDGPGCSYAFNVLSLSSALMLHAQVL